MEGRVSNAVQKAEPPKKEKRRWILEDFHGLKRFHHHPSSMGKQFPCSLPSLSSTLQSKQFLTPDFCLSLKLGVPWSSWTSLQIRLHAMDGDMKKLRVRFPGVGKGNKGGSQTSNIPLQKGLRRAEMSSSGEYDAAFAATIAAAAYAIAAREQKKPIPIEGPPAAPTPVKAKSIKKPAGGSKISRWLSGKEPVEDEDGSANVSVRRPLKPTRAKPEDTASDDKVPPKITESSLSTKKGPGSFNKSADKKGSKRFEQEEAIQKVPSTVRPATSYHSRRNGDPAIGSTGSKTDEWEKAKLARVREEYEKMMETIAEWESEKKVKARCKKELKETELDRKRAKLLEEFNQEMSRINKISGGARSMAEERKYSDEKKIREKASKMRSTGKVPRTCACF